MLPSTSQAPSPASAVLVLDPAAGVDAQAPFLHRDDEEHSVIYALAAQLPLVGDAPGEFLDGFVADGRHDQDCDLRTAFLLECRKRRLQRVALRRREHAGL